MKHFHQDNTTISEAKEAAERLAFYPMMYQAAMSLKRLGILQKIKEAKKGVSSEQISLELGYSQYGIETLAEACLSLGLLQLTAPYTYVITKTGIFWLTDQQVNANANFVQDICYQGMFHLDEAIKEQSPAGLQTLGNWDTVYEGLSQLSRLEKESWFGFDHFYSDRAFKYALLELHNYPISSMLDIGGNTGKWATYFATNTPDAMVTIVDLPGQCKMAKQNILGTSIEDRVKFFEVNLLSTSYTLPGPVSAIWMSQFLDCFGPEEIVKILSKCKTALAENGRVFIMETFWDNQKNETATYCLHGTSLYFTAIANGTSKMYESKRMMNLAERAGLVIEKLVPSIGPFHSLLVCKKG